MWVGSGRAKVVSGCKTFFEPKGMPSHTHYLYIYIPIYLSISIIPWPQVSWDTWSRLLETSWKLWVWFRGRWKPTGLPLYIAHICGSFQRIEIHLRTTRWQLIAITSKMGRTLGPCPGPMDGRKNKYFGYAMLWNVCIWFMGMANNRHHRVI